VVSTTWLIAADKAIDKKDNEPYEAPDVTFKMDKETKIALSSLKGKVVLMQFGRVGANASDAALSVLGEILDARKDKDVAAYYLDFCQGLKSTKEYFEKNPAKFTVLSDYKEKVSGKFHVPYLPCVFVIDKFGFVRHVGKPAKSTARSAPGTSKVGALVDELLKEESAGKSFTRDPRPAFSEAEPVTPITIQSVNTKKKYSIYRIFSKAEYTFVIATFVG
jgi:peroxiredoxin